VLWGPDQWDAWTADPPPPDEAGDGSALLRETLLQIPRRKNKTVADLGCGEASLTRFLASRFGAVTAIDYAPETLFRNRSECAGPNVTFHRRDLRDLTPFRNRFHVAVAAQSITGPSTSDVDRILSQVWNSLVEGGVLIATLPAGTGSDRPVTLVVADPDRPRGPFHEVELQYRIRRAGFQGVRIRRIDIPAGPMLLVLAVRRGLN
jgi:trans-aconitate methyltransferase